jgi:hypothetical protein
VLLIEFESVRMPAIEHATERLDKRASVGLVDQAPGDKREAGVAGTAYSRVWKAAKSTGCFAYTRPLRSLFFDRHSTAFDRHTTLEFPIPLGGSI